MSIPEGTSNKELIRSIRQDRCKLLGLLKASRGSPREPPCPRCRSREERSPFVRCFVVDLGGEDAYECCATCDYTLCADSLTGREGSCYSELVN